MPGAAVSVYVDTLRSNGWVLRGRRVQNCHMLADTLDELHAMARQVGMRIEWFQPSPPASADHYDLTARRRADAVAHGAIELDDEALVKLLRSRRRSVGERPRRAT